MWAIKEKHREAQDDYCIDGQSKNRVYNTPSKKISTASDEAGRSPPLTSTFLKENQQIINNTAF